ncbi:MAG: prephenate dehydrogenase [Candidatus Zixiibacteriota bacterium]
MFLRDHSVGIIGLGQMGGSMAAAIKQFDPAIVITGCDLDESLCRQARERGLIDVIAVNEEDVIDQTEVVIIALPALQIGDVLRMHRETLREKLLVTDTGSLKRQIMATAKTCEISNFVGGHPLAGTELRGEKSWNADLFREARYFTTENSSTQDAAKQLMAELIGNVGAEAIAIDPGAHDKLFAVSSNLPHLFAYILRAQFEQAAGNNGQLDLFACPSYRGATRVAGSDSEMVFQMLWGNRDYLGKSLSELRVSLNRAQKALDSGDEKEFRRIFGAKQAG